jgi:hypothetical protein
MITRFKTLASLLLTVPVLPTMSAAGEGDAEIAKKLNNPVSNLISVPIQANWDFRIGPRNEGNQFKLNFQPVIPIDLQNEFRSFQRKARR